MSFSLDSYRIFNSVVKNKSFSAAAAELYITQPAVSQSVRQMENEFGARLFFRTKKGIVLTREGEILSGYISSALSMIEAGEQRVKRRAALSVGTLKLGASDTISKWFLTPFIEEFHRLYPDIALSITNRTSHDILKLLSSGLVDIGYVSMPLSESGISVIACKKVHDIFIAGKKYSQLKGRTVRLGELSGYPLIMLERAANSRRWVDRHFLSQGIYPQAQIELGAHDLISDYVKIGLGIGCVIKEFSNGICDDEDIFEVQTDCPIPERSIGVCYPTGIELSAAAKKFIELTQTGSEI